MYSHDLPGTQRRLPCTLAEVHYSSRQMQKLKHPSQRGRTLALYRFVIGSLFFLKLRNVNERSAVINSKVEHDSDSNSDVSRSRNDANGTTAGCGNFNFPVITPPGLPQPRIEISREAGLARSPLRFGYSNFC